MTRGRIAPTTLLLGLALACQTARPKTTPSAPAVPPPEFIGSYVGQRLILRHHGTQQRVALTRRDLAVAGGDCDMGVEVREASFEAGTAAFKLEALGPARLPDKPAARARTTCGTVSGFLLSVSGFAAGDAPEAIRTDLDKVLATPEAYLAANGIAFDRRPGPDPPLAASQEKNASFQERALARQLKAWPRILLRVDPFYRDPGGRVHHEGEVEFSGVVGDDGRLHSPKLRTALSSAHEEHVLRALSLWLYEPAQGPEGATAARIGERCTFRVY